MATAGELLLAVFVAAFVYSCFSSAIREGLRSFRRPD